MTAAGPRFVLIDPSNLEMVCDDEDIDNILRYVIEYETVDRTRGIPVIRRQTIEPDGDVWTIVDEQQALGVRGGGFEFISSEVWPYTWAPIVTCQNLPIPHEIWGRPDLSDAVINLSQSARFTMSNLQRIVRLHAHPKLVLTGARVDEMKAGAGAVIGLPADATLTALETTADLPASSELYNSIIDAALRQAATPAIATGDMSDVGQLSGLALRILYGPLLNKTAAKHTTYGDFLTELARRLLEMSGIAGATINVIWPSPLPTDEAADAAAASAWQAAGVSVETTLTKAGYDAAEEASRRDDETANAGTMFDGFALGEALADTTGV